MKLPGLNFNKSMATSFIYVLCGILIRNVFADDLESNNDGVTWFEASNICKKQGRKLEHDLTQINLADLRGKQFWIGLIRYEELSGWIKPLGCYDFNGYHKTPFQASSTGLCEHHCNRWSKFSYQIFSNGCICIDVVDKSKRLEIKNCLVSDNKNSMMVYERYNSVELIVEDHNENCLVAKCTNQNIHFEAHTCINKDFHLHTLCDNKRPPDNLSSWTYNFTTAQDKCNAINKNLIKPSRVENCDLCTRKCWTSVYRENILVEYFDVKWNNKSAKDCRYGDARNSSDFFEIISTSCLNKMRFFACTPYNNETRTTMHMENYSSSQTNGALIGGIVGGIMVITFAVLLIIFIYRKRNTKTPKKEEVYSNSNSIGSRGNGKQFSNMGYDLADNIINDSSSSNKAILLEGENKLIPEYSKVDISRRRCTSNEDVYNTASEGEYDKLNNVLSRKNNNETNLYGITEHGAEGEYDTMKGALQVKRTEDLYDTNVPVYGGKGDSLYDTANQFQQIQINKNSTYGYSP